MAMSSNPPPAKVPVDFPTQKGQEQANRDKNSSHSCNSSIYHNIWMTATGFSVFKFLIYNIALVLGIQHNDLIDVYIVK